MMIEIRRVATKTLVNSCGDQSQKVPQHLPHFSTRSSKLEEEQPRKIIAVGSWGSIREEEPKSRARLRKLRRDERRYSRIEDVNCKEFYQRNFQKSNSGLATIYLSFSYPVEQTWFLSKGRRLVGIDSSPPSVVRFRISNLQSQAAHPNNYIIVTSTPCTAVFRKRVA